MHKEYVSTIKKADVKKKEEKKSILKLSTKSSKTFKET